MLLPSEKEALEVVLRRGNRALWIHSRGSFHIWYSILLVAGVATLSPGGMGNKATAKKVQMAEWRNGGWTCILDCYRHSATLQKWR